MSAENRARFDRCEKRKHHLAEWDDDLALADDNADYTLAMDRYEKDTDRVCSCKEPETPLFVDFLHA